MNKAPLASVIIPSYNTEKYIEEMLKCVIHQTYEKIEIIVIDDGSTDNTKKIVERYREEDNRIVLIEGNRRGVSHARNIGIEHAKGEVLFFWDSDDLIEVEYISKAIAYRNKNDVESVLVGWANYKDGIKQEPEIHYLKAHYRDKEIVEELIPKFIGHSYQDINNWIGNKQSIREGKESTACWRIMFDHDVIRRNQLRFDESLSLGEDTKFINEFFIYSKSVGFLDECLYYLRKRSDSANMTSLGDPTLMAINKTKLIDARLDIDKLSEKMIGKSVHSYWCGTPVFSAMELGIRLSHYTGDGHINRGIYNKYCKKREVINCIKNFHPNLGIKGIPFFMLKYGMGNLLYTFFKFMPDSFVSKFSK